jgi:hypothetical protein
MDRRPTRIAKLMPRRRSRDIATELRLVDCLESSVIEVHRLTREVTCKAGDAQPDFFTGKIMPVGN